MDEERRDLMVNVDFLPDVAKNPEGAESLRQHIRQQLEQDLDGIIGRMSQLPVLMVHANGAR